MQNPSTIYPDYLAPYVVNAKTINAQTTLSIGSSTREESLELWFAGTIERINGKSYLVGKNDFPRLLYAVDAETQEKLLPFDGAVNGYNGMFCNTYAAEELTKRKLERYNAPAACIRLTLGYGIDSNAEREDYDIDDRGNVTLNKRRNVLLGRYTS